MCSGSRVPLSDVKQHIHGKLYDELNLTVLPRAADCTAMLELADPTMIAELGQVAIARGNTAQRLPSFPSC